MATAAANSPAERKRQSIKAAHDEVFKKLEMRFTEFSMLPNPPKKGYSGTMRDSDYISQRVQKRNGDFVNQYRNNGMVKGGGAEVSWDSLSSAPGGPQSRVGMTLSRLGAGHHARLVLFGGLTAGTSEAPQGGFAPNDVELFDPVQMRWCTAAGRGSVRGRAPAPRAGHAASPLGRHLVVYFGGRTELGLSAELSLLAQYRIKARATPTAHPLRLRSAPLAEDSLVAMRWRRGRTVLTQQWLQPKVRSVKVKVAAYFA